MKLFSQWLETLNQLPSVAIVKSLMPQILKAAQFVYDSWEQDEEGYDEELGSGGICQDIAEAIGSVISSSGIEIKTLDNNGMGDQHVWIAARFKEGIYEIDIPPGVYETGAGYSWKKNKDVKFKTTDVEIYRSHLSNEDFDDESW